MRICSLERKPALGHCATGMRDRRQQVTPICFSFDGERVRLNSTRGRVNDRNKSERPQVSLSIVELEDAYRYIAIMRGVTDLTEEGGDAHIELPTKQYLGKDRCPWPPPGEVRIVHHAGSARVQASG
jgi:hypothetical protein